MSAALAIVNNHISMTMLKSDLQARGIALSETTIITLRDLEVPNEVRQALVYPGMPERGVAGQRRFVRYYVSAARILRRELAAKTVRHLYVVNNDNLLTSHILETALNAGREVTVVAEGLLNYLDADIGNLQGWRLQLKPVIARSLGLRFAAPEAHISGAFHPAVTRVVSFSAHGLRAPAEKTVVRPWPSSGAQYSERDPRAALIVHTGLAKFMSADSYQAFATKYAEWVRRQGFTRLYAKRHPRNTDPVLEELLPEHEIVGDGRPLEDLIHTLPVGVVIGPGTTPLVTLKLMLPELRCIDLGADFYLPAAYGGGLGASELFDAVGVERVALAGY